MSTSPGLIGADAGPAGRGRPGPPVSRRPPLVRPREGRMLAGVAAGLAIHLGIPVRAVRFGLVIATLLGGPGAVLYAWLWALVPDESSAAAAEAVESALRQSTRTPYVGGPILGTQIGGRPFPAPTLGSAGPPTANSVATPSATAATAPVASTDPAAASASPANASATSPATHATATSPHAVNPTQPPTSASASAPTAPTQNPATPGNPALPPTMTTPSISTVGTSWPPPTLTPGDPAGPGQTDVTQLQAPDPASHPSSGIASDQPPDASQAAQAAHAAAVAAAAAQAEQEERSSRRTRLRADLFAGLCLLAAIGVLVASWSGWELQSGLVLPVLIVASGAVIAYAQFDEADRSRWFSPTGFTTRAATLRLLLGVVLVVLGIVLLVLQNTDPLLLGQTLLATFAVLVGVAVVFAPWGVRFWRTLDAERTGRVRETERADIAAHLHDSVLQTLALIQRRSSDGTEVARLARAQERDLRGWLYGGADNDPTMISARVAALVADAEDVHGAVIEVVTVGDRPVDERAISLLSALREAVANAARHAGGESVRVYVECMPDGIEAFVRDRGPGFDLAAVPEDRLGVRESIIGRMERHGGSARIRSAEGEGTEVRLLLPDRGSEEEQ